MLKFISLILLLIVPSGLAGYYIYNRTHKKLVEKRRRYAGFESHALAILAFTVMLMVISILVTYIQTILHHHSNILDVFAPLILLMVPSLIAYAPACFIYLGVRKWSAKLSVTYSKTISFITAFVSFLGIVTGICFLVLYNIHLER